MKVRLFLRALFFVLLAFVKVLFGMDWALIVAVVVVVSDLDTIASFFDKKNKDC